MNDRMEDRKESMLKCELKTTTSDTKLPTKNAELRTNQAKNRLETESGLLEDSLSCWNVCGQFKDSIWWTVGGPNFLTAG